MPRFTIKRNYKFGILAIANTWFYNDLTGPLKINDNLWFFFSPPFPMSRIWRKWLGTFRAAEFLQSNLFIVALRPSQNIEILNHENKSLEDTVARIFYGLLLHGVARHSKKGFILTGSNKEGKKEIRSISRLFSHFEAANVISKKINGRIIQNAIEVSMVIKKIYNIHNRDKYKRFKKGFNIYINALREYDTLNRLHQFVQALEAVIKPEIGKTRRQFIHRCQTFIGRSDKIRKISEEIFDLRSRVEHLNDINDILKPYGKKNYEKIISLRAFQAELMAENVYLKILKSAKLIRLFITDNTIRKFWQKRDNERYNLWEHTLDIETLVTRRSEFFIRP